MASKAELTKAALDEMAKATITPWEWCRRIQHNPSYNYKNTHNYKAQVLLYQAVNTKNPSPAPLDLSDVQRCLFLTNDISRALETKNRLLLATADPNYRPYYTWDFIRAAVNQNRFRVWCDCHTTFPSAAFAWLDELGLPKSYLYGEGESSTAFTTGYDAGVRKFVVNMSALTNDQVGVIDSGEVLVTNELYLNKDPSQQADWRNANGVGSNCHAVYRSDTEGASYYSLDAQFAGGKINPSTACVYVAGFHDSDWQFVIDH